MLSGEERSRRKGRPQHSTPAPTPIPHPTPSTSHTTFSQLLFPTCCHPSLTHTKASTIKILSFFLPFIFTRLTLIPSFCCLAPCLFWSTSRANLKNAFAFQVDVGHTRVLYIPALMEIFLTASHESYMLGFVALRDACFSFVQENAVEKNCFLWFGA